MRNVLPRAPRPPRPTPGPRPRARLFRTRPRTSVRTAVAVLLTAAALLIGPAHGTPGSAVRAGAPGAAPGAVPGAAPGPAGARAGAPAAAPPHFAGRAFDTCEAPSVAVMRAWRRSSPYRAVGVYFGGRGRGCRAQRELNRGWVAAVHAQGWRMLPLFVGSQPPCVLVEAKRRYAIGRSPWTQGTREGAEAVRAARALGFASGSPLYLDIEAYRAGDARCAATTVRFVRGWNREVRRLGYLPGFYSSAETGVRQMERERAAGTRDLPAVVWFARWLGRPALESERTLHPRAWRPHARIHQYAGNVTETHGGRRIRIDRSVVDAPVARVTR
ncbi:DUF1906 domain-containing protein [Streptomyces sp. NPDC004787]|uniref:DUF1906 domain-containing protein n=1 Tax=Streptomyces sp. NPDC004787 TaxID=3154291 RepID=UPI0033A29D05